MRFVIQRVREASVSIDGRVYDSIGKGLLILCGISGTDDERTAAKMVKKACGLRIFEDSEGKTNLSAKDVGGEIMIISQFTLYADCKRGNRPGFTDAGKPDMASPLYEFVLKEAGSYFPKVARGIFGADMKVSLLNDGPFTILMDSDTLF